VPRHGRLNLLRRAPAFRLLFLATAGSATGTYLAAIVLSVSIFDRTGSGRWLAVLLIADFLPIVVIGLTLGPLIDRLSRQRLMITADLVRAAVFCALPFVDSPATIVALAGITGIATGFFRPAVYAGLPNLVDDDDLTEANSLFASVENLAWMIGPLIGGAILAVEGANPAYWINAVTFVVSAALVARIPAQKLQSEESLSAGHWRDVRDGLTLVRTSRALITVLVVWNVVLLGNAAVNVPEVVFAKDSLGAGNVGLGVLVGATGAGLTLGSFFAPVAMGSIGLRRAYPLGIALMSVGYGAASVAPSIWVAAACAAVATFGNGFALICNQVLVQRGAPDAMRGRALAVLFSTFYATLGLGMAAAGLLTDIIGGRSMWAVAAGVYLCGSVVALAMTRRLQADAVPEAVDEPPPRILFGVLAERRAAGRASKPPSRREKVEAGDAVSTGA
jgi:MFS family permease